jgi:hypothetical protein
MDRSGYGFGAMGDSGAMCCVGVWELPGVVLPHSWFPGASVVSGPAVGICQLHAAVARYMCID